MQVKPSLSKLAKCTRPPQAPRARCAAAMPLTEAELQAIRDECLCDDLDVDMERMSLWTPGMARHYFENNGEEPPTDPAILLAAERAQLQARLEKEGIGHVYEHLKEQTINSLVDLIRNEQGHTQCTPTPCTFH